MQIFPFVIKEPLGIHARPAGLVVKAASNYQSAVEIKLKDGRTGNLKKLFSVMALGVKCGDAITVLVDGPDETSAAAALKKFFEENL